MERVSNRYVKRTSVPSSLIMTKEKMKDLSVQRSQIAKKEALKKYLEYERAVKDPHNLKFMEFRRL